MLIAVLNTCISEGLFCPFCWTGSVGNGPPAGAEHVIDMPAEQKQLTPKVRSLVPLFLHSNKRSLVPLFLQSNKRSLVSLFLQSDKCSLVPLFSTV
jgi:hypothetical protein